MCQNKEVSLLITIFATAVIIKMCMDYKNTNEIKYLYMAVYVSLLSFIQFTEFFIHAYPTKSNVYQIASLCVVFGVVAQFVFSEICVHKYGNVHSAFYILEIVYYLGLIYFLPTWINNFGKYNNEFDCSNWFGCKLKWDAWAKTDNKNSYIQMLMNLIYAGYFCYATYLVFDTPGLIIYIVTVSMVFLPIFYHRFFGNNNSGGTGSAWCIIAILIILMYIIDFNGYMDSNITNS